MPVANRMCDGDVPIEHGRRAAVKMNAGNEHGGRLQCTAAAADRGTETGRDDNVVRPLCIRDGRRVDGSDEGARETDGGRVQKMAETVERRSRQTGSCIDDDVGTGSKAAAAKTGGGLSGEQRVGDETDRRAEDAEKESDGGPDVDGQELEQVDLRRRRVIAATARTTSADDVIVAYVKLNDRRYFIHDYRRRFSSVII